MKTRRPVVVLLIDDNPIDVEIACAAFAAGSIPVDVRVAADGTEALAFLRREAPHTDAPRPDLVLLDLNMPGLSGRETLAAIKQDLSLRTLPVLVMTTSRREEDLRLAYGLHANAYLQKPIGFDEFLALTRGILDFWVRFVTPAHREAA